MLTKMKICGAIASLVLAAASFADTTSSFTVNGNQFIYAPIHYPFNPQYGTSGFINIPNGGSQVTCSIANPSTAGKCQTVLFQILGYSQQGQVGGVYTACSLDHSQIKADDTFAVMNYSGATQTYAIQTMGITNLPTQTNPPTDVNITCKVQ